MIAIFDRVPVDPCVANCCVDDPNCPAPIYHRLRPAAASDPDGHSIANDCDLSAAWRPLTASSASVESIGSRRCNASSYLKSDLKFKPCSTPPVHCL